MSEQELLDDIGGWDRSLRKQKEENARLSAELAEAQRQVEFWKATAERRGDEIKRLYTEASHKEDAK